MRIPCIVLCFTQLCLCVLCMDNTLYAHYLYAYSSIQILTHFLFRLCVCALVFKKKNDHNHVSFRFGFGFEFVPTCMCVCLSCIAHFGIVFFITLVAGFLFAAWHTLLAHILRRELFCESMHK